MWKSIRFVLPMLVLAVAVHAQDLQLTIRTDQEVYLKREPISVRVELKNISNHNVKYNGSLMYVNNGGVHFKLTDASGHEYKYMGWHMGIESYGDMPYKIKPGESEVAVIPLLTYFGDSSDFPVKLARMFKYIMPGIYTLTASFGAVYAEPVQFRVIEPEGRNREAMEFLVQAYGYWGQQRRESMKAFWKIITDYPESGYTDVSIEELLYSYTGGGVYEITGKNYMELARHLVFNCPKSSYAHDNGMSLIVMSYVGKGSADSCFDFFEELLEKAAPTDPTILNEAEKLCGYIEREAEKNPEMKARVKARLETFQRRLEEFRKK